MVLDCWVRQNVTCLSQTLPQTLRRRPPRGEIFEDLYEPADNVISYHVI
jgi:hypothetical protein